ncbi:MAG: heptose-I-phosphate ethanolaminephosphotransferase [Cycloclasticus sp.]|jgi:heptose-I-phosphate ethanolaminephosphotransferase
MKACNQWTALAKLYFYFFLFSGPYQIAIYAAGMSNTTGIRDAVLVSTLWLIPVLIWPKRTRTIAAVIGALLWSASIVSWSYFYVFGQDFSQSVLFIIFESNLAESNEFIESYITPTIIGLLFIYACVAYAFWRQLEPVYLSHRFGKAASIAIFSFIFSWPLINPLAVQGASWDSSIKKLQDRIEPASPWNIVAGYFKYIKVRDEMEKQLANNSQIPPLKELTDANANKESTMVLVIGESTNAQRMSLYGYSRKTTPLLDSMRNELIAFNNVISPRPYTIEALQQVLTFADQQNPDAYLKRPTIMNMMRQAGYKSFWITNQQTQTKRNTMLLTFSQQTDEQTYLNNNRVQNSSQFDEAVLKPFEEALDDTSKHKFIIVHLIGTHRSYNYRYPEKFNHFKNRVGIPNWVPDDRVDEYNSYDNAVLYNDLIVSSLIKQLKKKAPNSALVYFSDHGEEVFDTKGDLFTGRNEAKPTLAMYTVPFIAWLSPSWQVQKNMNQFLNRPYLNSDFIYSWAELAGVNFQTYDPTRSIFNSKFIARKRFIGNPFRPKTTIDFDTLLHSKQKNLPVIAQK